MKTAQEWIEKLRLTPLPGEGGMYREVYRSRESIPADALPERFNGSRSFATSIYYLLRSGELSVMHRLRQDEVWHFYQGSPLNIGIIDLDGKAQVKSMGGDIDEGEHLQLTLPAGHIFGASVEEEDSYSLVGCTVAPGFDFADFEAPSRQWLLDQHPGHRELILRFTRP